MIISEIIGGLGNQMFQYAIGRSLSLKLNTNFLLDVKRFNSYTLHNFQLNAFNIQADLLDVENFNHKLLGKGNHLSILRNFLNNSALSFYLFNEKQFHYDKEVEELSGNIYIRGYWQSEKYFVSYANQIRKDFTVKIKPNSINKKYINLINEVNSVALHIRRGDYVTIKKTRENIGACSLDYYMDGIKLFEERLRKPHFFIFSDDPDWCKKNIKIRSPSHFITHNSSEEGYEDLRLMSNCKHFIISNSTFSWWGAWLSKNNNKIVITPKKWFNKNKHNTKDLIPENWIRF